MPLYRTKPSALAASIAFTLVGILAWPIPAVAADKNTLVGTIGSFAGPMDVAVSSDGSFALVSCYSCDGVSKVTLATDSVGAVISTGSGIPGYPTTVAIAPDSSFAIAVLGFADKLARVALTGPNAGTVTNEVLVGDFPEQVAFAPDGRYAYVASQGSNQLQKVDLTSFTVVNSLTVAGGPMGVTVSPDGAFAYVPTWQFGIAKVDLTTDAIVSTLSSWNHGEVARRIAVTPDGTTLMVALNNAGKVAKVRASDLSILTTYTLGGTATNVAIAADGNTAYALGVNSVKVIDLAADAVVASIAVSDPYGLAFSPDGAYAYVGRYSGGSLAKVYSGATYTPPAPAPQTQPSYPYILPDLNAGGPTVSIQTDTVTCTAGSYVLSGGQEASVQSAVFTLLVDGKRISTVSSDKFTTLPTWIVAPSSNEIQGTGDTSSAKWSRSAVPHGVYQCEVLAFQWHSTMLWWSDPVFA